MVLNMSLDKILGHSAAIFTVSVWAVTYIWTKYLLEDFSPTDILLIRFTIGFIVLKIMWPKGIKFDLKLEPYFMVAGLLGTCLYFYTENVALTMTTACNVGIILAITPLFTAITSKIFFPKEEKLTLKFFLGFIAALSGIILLSTKGNASLEFNPLGDSLAVLAGFVWSFYCVATKKANKLNYNPIQVTRRSFFWGIVFIVPLALIHGINITYENIIKPTNLTYLLSLGICASAFCFASGNYAVKKIGAVTTIVYLYATPPLTIIFAYMVLGEELTIDGFIGSGLILLGLIISQGLLLKPLKYALSKSKKS